MALNFETMIANINSGAAASSPENSAGVIALRLIRAQQKGGTGLALSDWFNNGGTPGASEFITLANAIKSELGQL